MGRVSQWAVRRPWFALLTWIAIDGRDHRAERPVRWRVQRRLRASQHRVDDCAGPAERAVRQRRAQVPASRARWSGGPTPAASTTQRPRQAMTEVLTEVSTSPGVPVCLSPYTKRAAGSWLPEPARRARAAASRRAATGGGTTRRGAVAGGGRVRMAHFGQAGVSPDGTVAYATVTFEGETFDDLDNEDILDRARTHQGAERRGRAAGRCQWSLRLRLGRGAILGEHRRGRRTGHLAVCLRLACWCACCRSSRPPLSVALSTGVCAAVGRAPTSMSRCSRRSWRR